MFSNVGGELSLEGVSVVSSNLISLVSVGSGRLDDSEGSAFLRGIMVTESEIEVSAILGVSRHYMSLTGKSRL